MADAVVRRSSDVATSTSTRTRTRTKRRPKIAEWTATRRETTAGMVWAAAGPHCLKSRHHARIVLRATQSHEAASSNRARLASDRVLRRAQPRNANNNQPAVRFHIDRNLRGPGNSRQTLAVNRQLYNLLLLSSSFEKSWHVNGQEQYRGQTINREWS